MNYKNLLAAFVFILVSAFIFSCEEAEEKTEPLGSLENYSDCLNLDTTSTKSIYPDESCIRWQLEGNTLLLTHKNAGFYCTTTPEAVIQVSGNLINIQQSEIGDPSDCKCLVDLEMKIEDIEIQEYTIMIIEPHVENGMTEFDFTIDLIADPTGIECVNRDQYPWGDR